MDDKYDAVKKQVLDGKTEWQKKTTQIELSLWDCANIHAAVECMLMYLSDPDAKEEMFTLANKFRDLKFSLKKEL